MTTASIAIMRIVLAVLLGLHGVAHLAGFLKAWAPTRTTIFGDRIDLGVSWIKFVGLAWLILALAFGAAGIATLAGMSGWPTFAFAVTGASLVLCLLQLPETKFGVVLNLGLLAVMVFGQRAGWL